MIEFDYDANGNLESITLPTQPAVSHAFNYLPRGQLQFYVAPQPGPPLSDPRTQYQYNLSGQLTRIIRPDGQRIFHAYDPPAPPETGQLLAHVLQNAQLQTIGQIDYAYDDGTGNLESATTSEGQILVYDFDGSLPKSETWSVAQGGVGIVGGVSRTFDTSFRVTSQSVNGGSTIIFVYDDDDLLTSAGVLSLGRDGATGLLTDTALANATDSYGYDTQQGPFYGEVTSYSAAVNGATFYDVVHTRDALGRITVRSESFDDGLTFDTYGYTYDAAGRLTDVTKNSMPVGHYEYDPNGNRIPDADTDMNLTFNVASGVLGTADYDAQDRLLSTDTQLPLSPVRHTEYAYTANGELEAKVVTPDVTQPTVTETTTYHYDLFGNLLSVTLPSTDEITYLVDGQNRRVGKAVNGTLVQGFLYDGQLQVVAELNGSNQVVSRFVYASKANVPDYMISGGATYRIISDHLGSVRLVANASTGAVAQRIDYDEFGNVLTDTSPGFQPFGFAGGLYDPDTGLVRFGARDYDPATGRWTAKDPIRFRGGDGNLYAYVLNDPINLADQKGHEAATGTLGQLGAISVQLNLGRLAFFATAPIVAAVVSNTGRDFCYNRWEMEDDKCWQWVNLGIRAVRACCGFRKFWPVFSGNSGRFVSVIVV